MARYFQPVRGNSEINTSQEREERGYTALFRATKLVINSLGEWREHRNNIPCLVSIP